MTIHNDNNIKAVEDFTQAYSERLQSMCEALKGLHVYCVDIDRDNIPDEFFSCKKKDFDSPYSTKEVKEKRYIFRSTEVCASYSLEEEIALIAHEFGHIILEAANIKLWYRIMDEIFCDNLAHSLDLSDHIITALDTMSKGGFDNASEIADRKMIAESVKACKDNIPPSDPKGTLNGFLNSAVSCKKGF